MVTGSEGEGLEGEVVTGLVEEVVTGLVGEGLEGEVVTGLVEEVVTGLAKVEVVMGLEEEGFLVGEAVAARAGSEQAGAFSEGGGGLRAIPGQREESEAWETRRSTRPCSASIP